MSQSIVTADRPAIAPAPQPAGAPARIQRVFSGIQPTGIPHIGNYLGAMQHWVVEQTIYESIFCIVDMHAITILQNQNPQELRANVRAMAAMLLAVGLEPERAPIFVQSHVSAHAELAWMLDCVTSLGWLNRMHQFKSKAGDDRESASAGLYTYPVLMAADIVLYDSDLVPVGDDQRQHIELTRDVVERFNERFGETFVLPNPLIREQGARIMALDDPTAKMSKTHPAGCISLLDSADEIKRKIARATTDSQRTIVFDPERTGLSNLLAIYQILSGQSEAAIAEHFADKGYKELKGELTDLLVATLTPIQQRYNAIMVDPARLEAILAASADRVRPRAEATLHRAQKAMGLG